MGKHKRDEFGEPVKRAVAARVAYLCSNPDCRAPTTGPHDEPTKAVNLGVAAHITAAAPGGERYDAALTTEQRTSAENALWLCQNCAKLIDNDSVKFTRDLLLEWRERAEEEARSRVGKSSSASPPMVVSSSTPDYPNAQIRFLSERLADAQARKQRLQQSGADTSEIVREILGLKRQIREGGQLHAGDYLGDGRFLLLDKVGGGGFGTVWRARDSASNEIVAIKVLHSNLAGDPERLARFHRGARIMKELEHAAVVRVLKEHEEDDGWHYYVMEFLAGGDFRRAVLEQRIDAAEAVFLMVDICDAMALAHSRGIVHRDIKPANILLSASGEAKLTDFDLVSAPDTTGGTRTGAMGTFAYTDPTCVERPMDADPRADVYSLAMSIIFIVCGMDLPPATHGRAQELIRRLSLPFPIREVLLRATDVNHREVIFADAGALRDALRDALNCDRFSRSLRVITALCGRLVGWLVIALIVMLGLVMPIVVPVMILSQLLPPEILKWVTPACLLLSLFGGIFAMVRALRWIHRRHPSAARWMFG